MRGKLIGVAAGVLLAVLLAATGTVAGANVTPDGTARVPWERTYGGLANESLLALASQADGGYLLAGVAANTTSAEVYLVRTDSNGTALRETRTPYGAGTPVGAAFGADGDLVASGATAGGDVALARFAPDGRRTWSRTYAVGTGRETGDAVRAATDGGFLVAGTTDVPSGGAPALLLLKVGEDGGQVWQRTVTIGGSLLAVGDLLAAPDGGYLVVGSTDAARAGTPDLLLVKLSSGGNREWQRTYALGSGGAEGAALAASPDGGWLLLGTANATGSPAAVLVKVDTAGNEQWRQTLAPGGAATRGHALARAGPDGYAVAGEAGTVPESYVARLDRNGAGLWNRTFSIGDGPSRAMAIAANATGDRLVAGGEASRTAAPLYDLYLASVVPSVAAPGANATANVTPAASATASPNGTAPPNATPPATGTVPAPTQAPLALPLCLAAVAGAALATWRRR